MEAITAWKEAFNALTERIGKHFHRSEARARARSYLQGLLSDIPRKNNWQMAELLGEETPYGLQQFLYRSKWEADRVRDDLQHYVIEHLGEAESVLVVDETGFLKKGDKSVGVQVRYGWQDGQLPGGRVSDLCQRARSHVSRSRALSA